MTLTQKDVSGPAMDWPEGSICDSTDLASFRLLVVYHVGTDEHVLRLDVKVDALQHNVSLPAQLWRAPPGSRIQATDPLIEPSKGVDRAAVVRVDRLELAAKLHELAGKLEQMR